MNPIVEPIARSAWSGPFPFGAGLALVETIGRRTGARRSRPLLTVRTSDVVIAGTVRRHSDWVSNVRSEPSVRIWLGGESTPAEASVIPLPIGWLAAFRVDNAEPVDSLNVH